MSILKFVYINGYKVADFYIQEKKTLIRSIYHSYTSKNKTFLAVDLTSVCLFVSCLINRDNNHNLFRIS